MSGLDDDGERSRPYYTQRRLSLMEDMKEAVARFGDGQEPSIDNVRRWLRQLWAEREANERTGNE
jgi:hypothetical protein